jgi:hypothetical protein
MPKVTRRRSHNCDLVRRKWSRESMSQESAKSSIEEEVMIKLDDDFDLINFSNESILNSITDLFSFCKDAMNTRFIILDRNWWYDSKNSF